MIVDLVNISYQEIENSSLESINDESSLVAYLQNNGDKNHSWSNEKFASVVDEDIDY